MTQRISDDQARRWSREHTNDVISFGAALADCAADLEDARAEIVRLQREMNNAAGQTTDDMCRVALYTALGPHACIPPGPGS